MGRKKKVLSKMKKVPEWYENSFMTTTEAKLAIKTAGPNMTEICKIKGVAIGTKFSVKVPFNMTPIELSAHLASRGVIIEKWAYLMSLGGNKKGGIRKPTWEVIPYYKNVLNVCRYLFQYEPPLDVRTDPPEVYISHFSEQVKQDLEAGRVGGGSVNLIMMVVRGKSGNLYTVRVFKFINGAEKEGAKIIAINERGENPRRVTTKIRLWVSEATLTDGKIVTFPAYISSDVELKTIRAIFSDINLESSICPMKQKPTESSFYCSEEDWFRVTK